MSTHTQSRHAEFPAFGSYGYLAVRRAGALPRALRVTQTVIKDVDATCSRFRADSDLARVNREPGRWVEVHPLLVEAVRVGVRAAAATDGLVHPLLGRPLVTLGYDRDFRELRELETAPTDPPAAGGRCLAVDRARRGPHPHPGRHRARPGIDGEGLGRRPGRGRPGAGARRAGTGEPRRRHRHLRPRR